MFSQFFGSYLVKTKKISTEQFASCMEYAKASRVKLGLIAEDEGMLTRQQANELNFLQMQSDKRFGDLAIEKGYLTESDISYLIGLQGSPYFSFVQALQDNDIMDRDQIRNSLESYQKESGFSDEIMDAIKNGDIEKLLPVFLETEDEKLLNLAGLALRNIIRFVSSYLRIDKAVYVKSFSARYIAYQKTVGDRNGFLGFSCDNDDILSIAEGFANESFDEVDEDALDAVAEFTNCVNGLYAAELSYKGTSIDMLPPEILSDATIEEDTEFCVVPIYIENKKSHLIIKID